jgi:hypothetical protein
MTTGIVRVAGAQKSLVVALATAVTAIGPLICPAPAQAFPTAPVGECNQFGFPQHMTISELSDWGVELDFASTGASGSGKATAFNIKDTNLEKFGEFHGQITGSQIEIVVNYYTGQYQSYVGGIGPYGVQAPGLDTGTSKGVTKNNVPKESGIPWFSDTVLPCLATRQVGS